MGSVWVAEHVRLGGHVAVKFLSMNLLDHASARARFDKEAKWVAKIRSPHVVQVHDHGVTTGECPIPFIVMELLEGEDLANRIEREGPLSLYQASEILDQVCDALTKAHQVGIVHRDVKPENVFVLESKRTFVKLLDFGVAHADEGPLERLTQTGLLLGTAHYMSPEQLFSGKDIDHRADLWALGVLTYQMVTARLPFHGETFGSLCLSVRDGQFSRVSQLARVPVQLDAWFERALARDRSLRFQSAAEMSASFQMAMATTAAQFDLTAAVVGGTLSVASGSNAGSASGAGSYPGGASQVLASTGGERGNLVGPTETTLAAADHSSDSGGRGQTDAERQFGGTLSTDGKGALAVEVGSKKHSPRSSFARVAAVAGLAAVLLAAGAWRVLGGNGSESTVAAAPVVAAVPEVAKPAGISKPEAVGGEAQAGTLAAESVTSPAAAAPSVGVASEADAKSAVSVSVVPVSVVPVAAPAEAASLQRARVKSGSAVRPQNTAVRAPHALQPPSRSSLVESPHVAPKPPPSSAAPKYRGF